MGSLFPIAYIDPMSGAIILQVVIAGAIGCAAFFRRSITSLVLRVFGRKPKPCEEGSEQPASEGHSS